MEQTLPISFIREKGNSLKGSQHWFLLLSFIFLFFFLLPGASFSQLTEVWRTELHQSPEQGFLRYVSQEIDYEKNSIILGTVSDENRLSRVFIHKVDQSGNKIWSKTFNGVPESIAEQPSALRIDSKGNSYILARSDMAGNYQSTLIRYSQDGVMVWSKGITTSKGIGLSVRNITIGKDGAIYLVGNRAEGDIPYVVTQKLNSDGNITWEKEYTTNKPNELHSNTLEVDNQGGVYVPATFKDYTAATNNILVKYNAASGEEIFVKEFGQNPSMQSHTFERVMIAPSGIISLIKSSETAYYNVLTLYTFSASGDLLNTTNIGNDLEVRFDPILYLRRTAFTRDGHLLILGINAVYRSTPDYFLEKYTSNGTRVWQKTFNVYTEGSNVIKVLEPHSFDLNESENIVLSGNYSEFIPPPSFWEEPEYVKPRKITIAVLDQSGKELQRTVSTKDGQIHTLGRGINHIQKDDYYMTGWMENAGSSSLFAMKYAVVPVSTPEAWVNQTHSYDPETDILSVNWNLHISEPKSNISKYKVYHSSTEDGTVQNWEWDIPAGKTSVGATYTYALAKIGSTEELVLGVSEGAGYKVPNTENRPKEVKVNVAEATGGDAPTITTSALANSTFCAGVSVSVPFTTEGRFESGNTFTAQLSDASGSFDSPVNIGSGTASPISANIPESVAPGSGYRVRVIGSSPATTGTDNGTNFTINQGASKPAAISGNTTVCAGADNLTYSVEAVEGANEYIWSAPGFDILSGQGTRMVTLKAGNSGGRISVVAKGECGTSAASEKEVSVGQMPDVSISADGATSICDGGSVNLSVNASGNYTYQWARDGQNINGANSTSYRASASGNYTVQVSNGNCTRTTAAVKVEVGTAISSNTISGDQTICSGVAAEAITGSIPGGGAGSFNYQWEKSTNDTEYTAIQGATGKDYTPVNLNTTTWFRRKVTSGSCSSTSPAVKITVNTSPYVSLQIFESICDNAEPITLTGGAPEGGTYSGPGVSNGMFSPAAAGPGTHTITYTYAESGKCEASATQTIVVKSDCSVTGVEDEEPQYKLTVFPNPTSAAINVKLELEKRSDLTIRIIDARGRVLEEKAYLKVHGEFTEKIDLKGRATGMYLVQFITEDGVKTRRIVKQ